jgi:hypothetical protein
VVEVGGWVPVLGVYGLYDIAIVDDWKSKLRCAYKQVSSTRIRIRGFGSNITGKEPREGAYYIIL